MKKIPLKNYIILVALVFVTIFITYYCCNLYNSHHAKQYSSAMISFLTEIKEDDIDNYVLDRPTAVLYISDKTDNTLEGTEKSFKEYLTEKNIYSYFSYVDISKNKESALINFQETYDITLDYQKLPILVTFQDGDFKEIYNEKWDTTKIEEFLKRNEVVDCD